MYFRDASVAIIVFDLTNQSSLKCVEYWAEEVFKANADDFFIVLVGNKCDLERKRQVTREDGEAKAKEIRASFYYETSAIDIRTVQNLFQEIGIQLFKMQEDELIPDVSSIILDVMF